MFRFFSTYPGLKSALVAGVVFLAYLLPATAQDLIIDVVSKFEGNLTVSSGTLTLRVYDSFGTDVTNTVDVFFEFYAKKNCGQPVKNTITYPFGVNNPDPIKVTISSLAEGVYFYRLKAVSGSLSAYTQWFRLGIVKKDNTLPVASVSMVLIDTVRDANLKTVPELKLSGTATDDCTDTVSVYWEKISGPAATLADDFKGNLTLKDVAEGEYVFNMVAKDDRGGITRVEVKVIVRPPPTPPPPPVLKPMKAFSPNQDSIDDWWKVTGISAMTDVAEVQLISQFGQSLGSLRPPFLDDEVWDGTQFGKPMPEGAYYFIIKDKNKQEVQRGSILLVR